MPAASADHLAKVLRLEAGHPLLVFNGDGLQYDAEIVSNGNVYSAAAFLAGIAVQEADKRKLDVVDKAYPVIVTIRARKRA